MAGACNQGFDQHTLTDTRQLSCSDIETHAVVNRISSIESERRVSHQRCQCPRWHPAA